MLYFIARPDLTQRLNVIVEPRTPTFKRYSEGFVLLTQPADPEAELNSPTTREFKTRNLLGKIKRTYLRQDVHSCPQS